MQYCKHSLSSTQNSVVKVPKYYLNSSYSKLTFTPVLSGLVNLDSALRDIWVQGTFELFHFLDGSIQIRARIYPCLFHVLSFVISSAFSFMWNSVFFFLFMRNMFVLIKKGLAVGVILKGSETAQIEQILSDCLLRFVCLLCFSHHYSIYWPI